MDRLSARTVELPDGAAVRYDKLLLATGSAPRRPQYLDPMPPASTTPRSYNGAMALGSFGAGASLAVVGAGWIDAWKWPPVRVNVASTSPSSKTAIQPLLAALETVAKCLPTYIEIKGWTYGCRPSSKDCSRGKATRLRMRDGSTVAADADASRCGLKPNVELAQQAGLAMGEGGAVVDACAAHQRCTTSTRSATCRRWAPFIGYPRPCKHWANALKNNAVAPPAR